MVGYRSMSTTEWQKNKLALGVSAAKNNPEAAEWIKEAKAQNYGGATVYDVTTSSQEFLSQISLAESGVRVVVAPNCFRDETGKLIIDRYV